MRKLIIIQLLSACIFLFKTAKAQKQALEVSETARKEAFPLAAGGKGAALLVEASEKEVVRLVAAAFANDVKMVSGVLPAVNRSLTSAPFVVVAGTAGQSSFINHLAAQKKLDVDGLRNRWEGFQISIVNHPFKGVRKALVVAGSDARGTAYGLFHLSRAIGVQPYWWWADIRPQHKSALYLSLPKPLQSAPSVKYRGVFLNDEDWGLQPWAARHLDTDIKDIGPKTYEKVFELLLRLKANYIWPAMHECTRAFWYYEGNPKMAERWGIVLGASHCEPMLRNNVFEWSENFSHEYGRQPGEWRYDKNKAQIFPYWDDRAKASRGNDAVYTVGMRGIHDGSMPGPPAPEQKIKLLEEVIADQRSILSKRLEKEATAVPQIFCPYKEVLNLYQGGLQLPDDVTIAWADDNHGYVRQLSNPTERKRSGGSGVYYHLSYWGAPRDYLWLSSNSPSLISYEMSKAYRFGADRLWVVNVGDIKPAELETQFFMDLAWEAKTWTPGRTDAYLKDWATATFGEQVADEIAAIKTTYYRLAAGGKPEHLDQIDYTPEEEEQRLTAYAALVAQTKAVAQKVPAPLSDAYGELIQYPVEGAALMNEKILGARKSIRLAAANDWAALKWANKAKAAYLKIDSITRHYNERVAGGKWAGIMSWHPRDQRVFDMPETAIENDLQFSDPLPSKKEKQVDNITMPVDSFNKMITPANGSISVFNGLGSEGKSIAVYPYNETAYTESQITKAPFVEYTVNLPAGEKDIVVKCLPTFRLYDGLDLRYAVQLDADKPQMVSVNAKAETRKWAANVLRGYSVGTTTHTAKSTGPAAVRIYFLDPGLVVSGLQIVNK